jgi:hypothetical protein
MALDPAIVRLVIASRVVAFEDQGPDALRELDHASEAFAEKVPWADQPCAQQEQPLSASQKAYAMLWREMGPTSPFIREARKLLLSGLSKDQQRAAIAWVTANHPMTEREIAQSAMDA